MTERDPADKNGNSANPEGFTLADLWPENAEREDDEIEDESIFHPTEKQEGKE